MKIPGKYCISSAGDLCVNSRTLAHQDVILVDAGQRDVARQLELLPARWPAATKSLPYGDYVLVAGDKIVGIEEKRASDLRTSWGCRRLQRELRYLRTACDVAMLALRLGNGWGITLADTEPGLWLDLIKWRMLDNWVILLPESPDEVLTVLTLMQTSWKPGQHLYSVLAGTDQRPQGSVMERALIAGIPGLGPKRAHALALLYPTLLEALLGTDADWKAAGADKRVIEGRRALLPLPAAPTPATTWCEESNGLL